MAVTEVSHRPRAVDVYLGVGVAAIGLYYLAPGNSWPQTVAYAAIGVYGVTGAVLGARRNLDARGRRPWYLFALGLAGFVAGDAIFDVYSLGNRALPFPSAADWIYLAAYPVLFLGIALLIGRLGRRESRLALIDAAIVTCGFVLVQWVYQLAPAANQGGSVLSRSIQVAYPAMDILVVAPLAGLVFARRARSTSFVLLLLAIVAMLVADEVYYGNGVSYRWLEAFWLASYVLWGAAALHPSVARLAERRNERDPQLNRGRLLLFAAAVLAGPVVLAVQSVRGKSTHPNVVAGFGGAISVLVLLRVAGLVRELAALREVERSGRIEAEAANVVVSDQNLQLRELDRLKDEFVGLVSHELRTPLTSITGYVELLESDETGPLNKEQRVFLATVARNADRLLRLVNDMLFVARLHSGMLELELDPVDLASLVEHAVANAGPGAEAKGLRLELVSTGETAVLGDEERLAQLLDNLVSNAVKFTPGGGSVTVRLWAEDGAVVLEVTDSGIGIPEGERERLFERFYRASTAVSQQIQGTGLGLHVAQAIVAAHGGVISVSSEVGSGTTLRVELPAAPVASKVGV